MSSSRLGADVHSEKDNDEALLSYSELILLRDTLQDKDVGMRSRIHYFNFRAYPKTFTGLEVVRWLVSHDIVINREDSILVAKQLLKMGHIVGVAGVPKSAKGEEVFSEDRLSLYSFSKMDRGERQRRVTRLGKADSRIFSKTKWKGYFSRRSEKKKVRRLSMLFPENSKSGKNGNLPAPEDENHTRRDSELEAFAKGKTALQMAVDEGYDYKDVIVPTHVPLYNFSEGCILRKAALNADSDELMRSYHFHHNMHLARRSKLQGAALVTVPKTNTASQGKVLFYMIEETDRVRTENEQLVHARLSESYSRITSSSQMRRNERQEEIVSLHQRATNALS